MSLRNLANMRGLGPIDKIMDLPILSTKLFIPRLQTNIVFRDDLFEHLDKGISRLIIFVTAPAGYGKTTTISTWLSQLMMPAAWISLNEKDNDFYCFFSYLITALRNIEPDNFGKTLNLLKSSGVQPKEVILSQLVNDLAELTSDCILVLEDYHQITSMDIHEALGFILDNHIPNLHLVISSRVSPPFPVASLRASDQLVEITHKDLRFSRSEISTYLEKVHQITLTDREIDKLEAKTEGWIAGIQLVALLISEGRSASEVLENLSGANRYFTDYFMDVIFSKLPEFIQSFLLRTSVLEQLSGSLCDFVTGYDNSINILKDLEKKLLFTAPIDEGYEWYRYHNLFREMLQTRLKQSDVSQYYQVLTRASIWYEKQHEIGEAIDYAFLANDYLRASELLEKYGFNCKYRYGWWRMSEWLKKLPAELLSLRLSLRHLYFWTLMNVGEINEARRKLDEDQLRILISGLTQDDAKIWEGNLLIYKSAIAMHSDYDIERGQEFARRGLETIPQCDPKYYRTAMVHYGHASLLVGDIREAKKAFRWVLDQFDSIQDTYTIFFSMMNLAEISIREGYLHKALDEFEETISFAEKSNLTDCLMFSKLKKDVSDILYEWNEPDEACSNLVTGIRNAERYGDEDLVVLLPSYASLLRIQLAYDDFENAQQTVRQIERVTHRGSEYPYGCRHAVAARALLALFDRDYATATEAARILSGPSNLHSQEYILLTLSRVHLATHKLEEAIEILNNLRANILRQGRYGDLIKTQILLARAYFLKNDLDSALLFFNICMCHFNYLPWPFATAT